MPAKVKSRSIAFNYMQNSAQWSKQQSLVAVRVWSPFTTHSASSLKDRATIDWREESNGWENEGNAWANQQLDLRPIQKWKSVLQNLQEILWKTSTTHTIPGARTPEPTDTANAFWSLASAWTNNSVIFQLSWTLLELTCDPENFREQILLATNSSMQMHWYPLRFLAKAGIREPWSVEAFWKHLHAQASIQSPQNSAETTCYPI